MITTSDFKTGMTIEYQNNLYSIIEFQHVKPGKGQAFVRTRLVFTTGVWWFLVDRERKWNYAFREKEMHSKSTVMLIPLWYGTYEQLDFQHHVGYKRIMLEGMEKHMIKGEV